LLNVWSRVCSLAWKERGIARRKYGNGGAEAVDLALADSRGKTGWLKRVMIKTEMARNKRCKDMILGYKHGHVCTMFGRRLLQFHQKRYCLDSAITSRANGGRCCNRLAMVSRNFFSLPGRNRQLPEKLDGSYLVAWNKRNKHKEERHFKEALIQGMLTNRNVWQRGGLKFALDRSIELLRACKRCVRTRNLPYAGFAMDQAAKRREVRGKRIRRKP
jgi:hypothetical protein